MEAGPGNIILGAKVITAPAGNVECLQLGQASVNPPDLNLKHFKHKSRGFTLAWPSCIDTLPYSICNPHAFAPSPPHCLSQSLVMSAGASWTVQVTTCTGTGTGPHGAQWGTHEANTKSGAFLHWGDNVSTSQERFCYKLIMFTFDTTSSTRLELYGSKVKPYSSNLELYSSIQNWFSIKITF